METPPISYPQLFSFQVSYAGDPGNSRNSTAAPEEKKGLYRQGCLEVDFYMEALFIHDRDRIFMSQSFSALRNHVDAEYLDDCSISIKFDSEEWKITSQNIAEKTCIQHLLESIVNETPMEEALQIGKEKGIIGLDKSIQKHGHILRRAANHNKVEERYLILVPGKLLLFKSLDIIGKHVRHATSLLGASVRTLPKEQEFQVSGPGSKTMSLIAPNSNDYDAWVEAVETSIEYTKQAARAAGMATLPTKKQRRSRGSKVQRVQWDNGNLNQQVQLLERGEHTRIDAEAVQLNQQAVSPSRDENPLRGDCPSNGHLRAAQHESKEVRPDRIDARKQSKAMMCLESALNEMKLAISNIRTVPMPLAPLWHKANLSPPRSYRGFDEHGQSRPDWEERHWLPSSGHSYIDALISPRTRETLASSHQLRRSWDSSSIVDTGVGVPRYPQVVWRSQTMEDLNSSAPMYRDEKSQGWRNSTKLKNSAPITKEQQRSAHMDQELHEITSSDEEEHNFPPEKVEVRSSLARVINSHRKASMTTNGLVPEFAASSKTISGMPSDHPASSNAFQSCSNIIDITNQPHQMLPPDMGLPERHAAIMSFDSKSQSTPESSTRTRKSRVKPLNFRAPRASKVTFLPRADAMDVADRDSNGCHSRFMNGSSGNYVISNRESALLTNSEMQRSTEKEMRSAAEAQAYANQNIQLPIKGETGMNGGASISDAQRMSRPQHNFEHPSDPQLHVINPAMLSEYSSSKEQYQEKNCMTMGAKQPEAAPSIRQVQGNFATHQANGYSNLGNLYNVVPNSNLQDESSRQYTDISRRLTQEAGTTSASAGEPPIFWESPLTFAGLAGPSGISTPSRRQSHTSLSKGMVQLAETSPAINMSSNQAGPYPPASRQYSQTLQEMKREEGTSNGHSYESSRRNPLISSVSADKVGLDALETGQFVVGQNGVSKRNNLSLGQSIPNTTQLRNSGESSVPAVVTTSVFGQAFISGADLLSKRQSHSVLRQQSSDLKAVSDGTSSQQPSYPLLNPESQNAIDRGSLPLAPNPYAFENRVTYADTCPYDKPPATNWESMHSQTGVEGFALAQSDPNNASTYARLNEQALNASPAVSITSDNMGASKCSEEAAPSVQVSDIAELVNRLVRITAGEGDTASLQGTSSLDRGGLNVDPLPAYNSVSQEPVSGVWDRQPSLPRVANEAISSYQPPNGVLPDSLSRVWDRPASVPMIAEEAASSYQLPPTNFYQPGSDEVSAAQTLPAPQMMVPNSNQDTNLALQLQGFGLLGGNGSSISGPITLKSADGEVIIIGKERRSSTGLLAPQGGEQVQGNLVKNGIQALKAQEERVEDPQQPSRKPSLAGEMGPPNGEGDAWSLAILKPGTPAQIFKFETH